MFGESGPNGWLMNGILIASGVLFVVAVVLFAREHSRVLASKGLTALAKAKSDATPAATDVPALSPWLAAGALALFGTYMFWANAIDESPQSAQTQLSGCAVTIAAPVQVRSTSSIVVEGSLDNEIATSTTTGVRCVSVLGTTVLIVDGVPSRDDFPMVLQNKKTTRRWFPATLTPGKHRLDVLSKEALGSFTAAAIVSNTNTHLLGKANLIAGCNTIPVLPPDGSSSGQIVAVDIKITCDKRKDLVPALFVNGALAKPLGMTYVGATRVFRWVFPRTAHDDRLDAVVADVADDFAVAITVRQPPTLGNVRDGLAAATGVLVTLSGLLIAVLQYFKGQRPAT
jgi:hypothetical protein